MVQVLVECWHSCSSGSNVEQDDIQIESEGSEVASALDALILSICVCVLFVFDCISVFLCTCHIFLHLSSDTCRRMERVKLLDVTVHTARRLKFK